MPLLSFLWLRGKCRYCRGHIGSGAFFTELAGAAIGLIAMLCLAGGQAIGSAVFGWLLLPLVILDWSKLWLPNKLVLLLAIVGLLVGPLLTPYISWADRAIGGIVGFASLEIVRQVFRKLRKLEGMGGGDPKLFGAIGLWLGWQYLPMTLLLACLLGFGVVLFSYARGKRNAGQLPFGAFLGVGAFVIGIWQPI